MAILDEDIDERELLEETVERDQQELREAVIDLTDAIRRPFQWTERIAEHPLPWLMGGVLLGFWLGASRRQVSTVD